MATFITLDGVDGGGKSTQIQLLAEWLSKSGRKVATFRDPGGTKLGEALREILLHRTEIQLDRAAEMLLYMASRAQLVAEKLRPALVHNDYVITDRFLLANVVYQGCAGGLDVEQIWQVGQVATGGLRPDITIVLDLPVDLAVQRIDRGFDRLESRGVEYFEQVRQGFLQQAVRASQCVHVVDASLEPEEVHRKIVAIVQRQMEGEVKEE